MLPSSQLDAAHPIAGPPGAASANDMETRAYNLAMLLYNILLTWACDLTYNRASFHNMHVQPSGFKQTASHAENASIRPLHIATDCTSQSNRTYRKASCANLQTSTADADTVYGELRTTRTSVQPPLIRPPKHEADKTVARVSLRCKAVPSAAQISACEPPNDVD